MSFLLPTWVLTTLVVLHGLLIIVALVMLFRKQQSGLSLLAQVLILLNIPVLGPAVVAWKNRKPKPLLQG